MEFWVSVLTLTFRNRNSGCENADTYVTLETNAVRKYSDTVLTNYVLQMVHRLF